MKIAYKIRRTTRSDTSSHASDPAPALAAVLARPPPHFVPRRVARNAAFSLQIN